MNFLFKLVGLLSLLFLSSCEDLKIQTAKLWGNTEEKKESLGIIDAPSILIENAKIYTMNGKTIEKGSILIEKGLISKVFEGKASGVGAEVQIVNAEGMQITPGLIDVHSHMGVYPFPSLNAHMDGNEMTQKATPQVNAKDSFWPQDPSIWRALEGGITTIQVLPGSANLIGGESFVAKLDVKTSAEDMRFKQAPRGIKMACGENPKRVYGKKGGPSTRMGNAAEFRVLFQKAKESLADGDRIENKNSKKGSDDKEKIDFANEAVKRVLTGETLVHIHCYRADDIATMISIAKEFGFKIKTFHHGLEAYKVKDILAEEDISVATWADWWGFKAEAFDGVPHNVALLQKAGARPIVHSDSPVDIRFLNIEAAKAWRSGLELGVKITEEQALSWITKNPAWALGVDHLVGTLEKGKQADLVVWDGHPLSADSKSQMVLINGKIVLNRAKDLRPTSDFEVGYRDRAFFDGRSYSKNNVDSVVRPYQFSPDLFKRKYKNYKKFIISKVKLSPKSKNYVDIVVEDGTISKIVQAGSIENKSSIRFDGGGKLITPGLIEMSSNLGLVEIDAEKTTNDQYSSAKNNYVDLRAEDALNLSSIRIAINRKEGVTTNFSFVKSAGEVQSRGVGFDLTPDRSILAMENPPVFTRLGKSSHDDKYSTRAHLWWRLRKLAEETYNYSNQQVSKFDQKLMLTGVDYKVLLDYFKGEGVWIFKADKEQDLRTLLKFKKDIEKSYGFKIKPVVLGGSESWLLAQDFKKNKIPVIVQPTELAPDSFDKLRVREDLASYLVNQGVDVVVTAGLSHNAGVRRLRQEVGFAMKYGLSWNEGLKSVTETPARILGLKQRGVIAEGARANLVLWTGDLTEPMHTAEVIWIDGKRQSLRDRQRQLAEKYL